MRHDCLVVCLISRIATRILQYGPQASVRTHSDADLRRRSMDVGAQDELCPYKYESNAWCAYGRDAESRRLRV
jgi:hypothetical protein